MSEDLASVLANEANLIHEASEALPHQFSTCTYSLGYIRQAVYLCLTCNLERGICSSCSIACHTDHEQLELFPKRHFRCDCPTESLPHSCTLHTRLELGNEENTYGQNFRGVFCRCGQPYDAKLERETMIQCLLCEDWYHESCLHLRERIPPRSPSPDPPTLPDTASASDTSSISPPAPLISDMDYESFICGSCVLANDTIKKYAGTNGALMVVRDDATEPWRILEGSFDDIPTNETNETPNVHAGTKRDHEGDREDEVQAKRTRILESSSRLGSNDTIPDDCIAPSLSRKAQRVLGLVLNDPSITTHGYGDVFLTDGWRSRWCKCASCLPPLVKHPVLLEEEDTYEPPEDPDSGLSLEELGMRALQRLPRDQAIDGIMAYNKLRDELMEYLRPFAQEGKVVSNEDVKNFFESRTQSKSQELLN